MASDKAITDALLDAVRDIYAEDIDKLSVNYVRRIVEEKLGLEEGSLKEEGWKGRSKEAITAEVVSCLSEFVASGCVLFGDVAECIWLI